MSSSLRSAVSLTLLFPLSCLGLACGSDAATVVAARGKGGASGSAGSVRGGSSGSAGTAGKAGSAGSAGSSGSPKGGSAGNGGTTAAGAGGSAGQAGAPPGGASGASGTGASGGSASGSAGSGGSGGSGGASAGSSGSGGNSGLGGKAGQAGAGGSVVACDPKSCQGACLPQGCCAAENVCDQQCCAGGQACLFGACVTPGATCQSAGDCGDGKYCETALGLGSGAGGAGGTGGTGGAAGGAGGPVCSQSLPQSGRCLPKAVVCSAPGVPAGCVESCEFKPVAGKLDAVKKWQWGPVAKEFPLRTDVWSSPAVGRVVDANCDNQVNELDPPNIVFVSGRSFVDATTLGTCCHCNGAVPTPCHTGALRVLDGRTGTELLSILQAFPGSVGMSGVSVALGDVNGDKAIDIVAITGEGIVVALDRTGKLIGKADKAYPDATDAIFGWGGGLALGDMDGDGHPEIALGAAVYSTKKLATTGVIEQLFVGDKGTGAHLSTAGSQTPLSYFVDLDGNGTLELLAGNTAYKLDGSALWTQATLADGFTAVADFDKNGTPEIVHVASGKLSILDGKTGSILLQDVTLPGNGSGGPPTVADFTGDGRPDVGVAQQNRYSVLDVDITKTPRTVTSLWSVVNHDLSSSVTGSSVFDFEGDGRAEVIYSDECFLWVFDGLTGDVRFATPTTSFTGTESSIVADVDGDGHAELIWLANGADPSAAGWGCDVAPWNQPDPTRNRPAWTPGPATGGGYRGLAVYGDKNNSWVGTRTLWNQHAYSVTNVCDSRDSACEPNASYGTIPMSHKDNWDLPYLNNFRQNVQDKGLFDAPDAIVSLSAACSTPIKLSVSLRNVGLAALPAGVKIEVLREQGSALLQTLTTTNPLGAGQTVTFAVEVPAGQGTAQDKYLARVPTGQSFRECREGNNTAKAVGVPCKD